jgi:hypothetical protein
MVAPCTVTWSVSGRTSSAFTAFCTAVIKSLLAVPLPLRLNTVTVTWPGLGLVADTSSASPAALSAW